MNDRMIHISTATFAAIWGARKPGEETEDDILRRLLGLKPRAVEPGTEVEAYPGYRDDRSGFVFQEGFEIERTYKGVKYRARVAAGMWFLENTGITYRSLNKLTRAVSNNIESAWVSWKYRTPSGSLAPIRKLRG